MKNSLQPKRDICLAVEKPRIKTRVSNWPFHLMNLWSEMRLINVPRFWNVHARAVYPSMIFWCKSPQHLPWRTSEHQRRTTSLWNQSCKWRCNRHSWWKFEFYNAMLPKICKFVCIAHKGYGQMDKSRSVVDVAGNSRQQKRISTVSFAVVQTLQTSRIFLHLQWLQGRKTNCANLTCSGTHDQLKVIGRG